MGIINLKAVVSNNGKSVTVDFLVDSGAQLTLLPLETWQALGLEPIESMEFTLADGTRIERKLSECGLSLMERSRHTPVILGEKGDEALLGVITLEEFGLILNPLNRTLVPMRMLLKQTDRREENAGRGGHEHDRIAGPFPGALGLGRSGNLRTNRTH